jgi:hypothetical protein
MKSRWRIPALLAVILILWIVASSLDYYELKQLEVPNGTPSQSNPTR